LRTVVARLTAAANAITFRGIEAPQFATICDLAQFVAKTDGTVAIDPRLLGWPFTCDPTTADRASARDRPSPVHGRPWTPERRCGRGISVGALRLAAALPQLGAGVEQRSQRVSLGVGARHQPLDLEQSVEDLAAHRRMVAMGPMFPRPSTLSTR
jgi:hypothetical protein